MLSLKKQNYELKISGRESTELYEVRCLVPCAKMKRGDGEGKREGQERIWSSTAKIQDSNPDIIDPQNLSGL